MTDSSDSLDADDFEDEGSVSSRGEVDSLNELRSMNRLLRELTAPRLAYLSLQNNPVLEYCEARDILGLLRRNTVLHSVDLQNAVGRLNGVILLKEMAAASVKIRTGLEHITHLNLARNNLGMEGARKVRTVLEFNRTLTSLDVSSNAFGDEGIYIIAHGLKSNSSLRYLSVARNDFGSAGARYLAKMLMGDRAHRMDAMWRSRAEHVSPRVRSRENSDDEGADDGSGADDSSDGDDDEVVDPRGGPTESRPLAWSAGGASLGAQASGPIGASWPGAAVERRPRRRRRGRRGDGGSDSDDDDAFAVWRGRFRRGTARRDHRRTSGAPASAAAAHVSVGGRGAPSGRSGAGFHAMRPYVDSATSGMEAEDADDLHGRRGGARRMRGRNRSHLASSATDGALLLVAPEILAATAEAEAVMAASAAAAAAEVSITAVMTPPSFIDDVDVDGGAGTLGEGYLEDDEEGRFLDDDDEETKENALEQERLKGVLGQELRAQEERERRQRATSRRLLRVLDAASGSSESSEDVSDELQPLEQRPADADSSEEAETEESSDDEISEDREFAVEMGFPPNTTLRVLKIGMNRIGGKGAEYFSKALRFNHSLAAIYFNGCFVGVKGSVALARALAVNRGVRVVNLWGNRVTDEGVVAIAAVLEKYNRTLTSINLGNNLVGEPGCRALGRAVVANGGLRSVRLAWNAANGRGLEHLCSALARPACSLSTLDLGNNSLTAEDFAVLLGALRSGNSLRSLTLSWNPLLGACELGELVRLSRLARLDLSSVNLSAAAGESIGRAMCERPLPPLALILESNWWSGVQPLVAKLAKQI